MRERKKEIAERRRWRLAEVLATLKGRWVDNHALSKDAKMSRQCCGGLLSKAVKELLVDKNSFVKNGRHQTVYRSRCADVQQLYDCMKPRWNILETKSIVDPARSESWFAVAERLMQQ